MWYLLNLWRCSSSRPTASAKKKHEKTSLRIQFALFGAWLKMGTLPPYLCDRRGEGPTNRRSRPTGCMLPPRVLKTLYCRDLVHVCAHQFQVTSLEQNTTCSRKNAQPTAHISVLMSPPFWEGGGACGSGLPAVDCISYQAAAQQDQSGRSLAETGAPGFQSLWIRSEHGWR